MQEIDAALEKCRASMSGGSKSFSLAAKLFPERLRNSAYLIYGWCRFCDDEIDRHAEESTQQLIARVDALRRQTISALRGEPQVVPEFIAFAYVARQYRIPEHYPLELLEGMAMDTRRETYLSIEALERYCYRVAGTVGLMMTHVMGITDHRALENACHLGLAMQLTNICRDVREDERLGRCYLPQTELAREGELRTVRLLLEQAERRYDSGRAGLRALPLSAAFAVAAASRVYREIGRELERRIKKDPMSALESRVVVSTPRKLTCLLFAIFEVGWTVPSRWARRRPQVAITQIWEHS